MKFPSNRILRYLDLIEGGVDEVEPKGLHQHRLRLLGRQLEVAREPFLINLMIFRN